MSKYIVKNCPALRGWVCNEQFIRQDKMVDCQDCTDCLIKRVIEAVKTEERTPEELDAIKALDKYLCQSARHNMSMMIQSMFEIQEVEE